MFKGNDLLTLPLSAGHITIYFLNVEIKIEVIFCNLIKFGRGTVIFVV